MFLQVDYPDRAVTPEQTAQLSKTVEKKDTSRISALFASVKSIPMAK